MVVHSLSLAGRWRSNVLGAFRLPGIPVIVIHLDQFIVLFFLGHHRHLRPDDRGPLETIEPRDDGPGQAASGWI